MIPKKIEINGFPWTVEYDKNVTLEGGCFGSIHYRSLKIFIDPEAAEQKQEQTLLHEIMHACMWQSGLGIRLKDKEVLREEDIVHTLSMIMYPVLKKHGFLGGKR